MNLKTFQQSELKRFDEKIGKASLLVYTKDTERLLPYISEVKKFLSSSIEKAYALGKEERDKAYGGCHNCYGKGYSLTIGSEGSDPTKPIKVINYCSCDRGEQLKNLLKNK